MIFLHVNSENASTLNDYVKQGKPLFFLIYWDQCGPCQATLPEWKKMENVLSNMKEDAVVAHMEKDFLDKINFLKTQPSGFPTILYITNNGKDTESYEDSSIETKDRTVDSFVDWVKSKIKSKQMGGLRRTLRKRKQRQTKSKKGGKWTRKYKLSINCKRPRGFSQKQYCKYGRRKTRR
jgi:hypothetical protein